MNIETDSVFTDESYRKRLKELIIEDMNRIFRKMQLDNENQDMYELFDQTTSCDRKSLQNWLSGKHFPHKKNIAVFYLEFANYKISEVPSFVHEFLKLNNDTLEDQGAEVELSTFFNGKRIEEIVYRCSKLKMFRNCKEVLNNFGQLGSNALQNLKDLKLISLKEGVIKQGKVTPTTGKKLTSAYIKNHVNNFDFEFNNEKDDSKACYNGMFNVADSLTSELNFEIIASVIEILNKYEEKTLKLQELDTNIPSSPTEASFLIDRISINKENGRLQ